MNRGAALNELRELMGLGEDVPSDVSQAVEHARKWVDPSLKIIKGLRPIVKKAATGSHDPALSQDQKMALQQLDQALSIVYTALVGAEEAIVDLGG